jgi:hypothetical protein
MDSCAALTFAPPCLHCSAVLPDACSHGGVFWNSCPCGRRMHGGLLHETPGFYLLGRSYAPAPICARMASRAALTFAPHACTARLFLADACSHGGVFWNSCLALVLPQVQFALGGPVKPLLLRSVSGKPRDWRMGPPPCLCTQSPLCLAGVSSEITCLLPCSEMLGRPVCCCGRAYLCSHYGMLVCRSLNPWVLGLVHCPP